MDELHTAISELISEEHRLRAGPTYDDGLRRLVEIETRLDQLWDLLRQRDARREFHGGPEAARLRSERVVESYLQ